ncbi:DUF2264 domain-containing protein [Solitalea koreensis]|uniref:DUF2264 domain-containing protein n=1 Tax=Solitalea koreensis TaxID=543615 RepID=A0A521BP72_9SPHI|nr:DUF2264 domain-containing protein [Solitalea koreensis]SMO48865.1 hypothetical protein SAMN06265350_102381 [Solitalea koreensis]
MKHTFSIKLGGLLLFAFIATSLQQNATAQSKKSQNVKTITTGAQDREYWCNTLYKIAYPVVHNLAEGTLRKNMPIEQGPGYYLEASKVTHLEAVGRTVAGIAPWLTLPDDNTKEGKMRKQLREELLKGLANAVNPESPDYLNIMADAKSIEHAISIGHFQPIVDAAYIAQAFIHAPKQLWEPLDSLTKKRFIDEFKSLRKHKTSYNNWLLFFGMTESFLLSIGEECDPQRLEYAFHKVKEWYVGDGWYSDGPKFSLDYYNSFVMHPMMVDMLKVMSDKKLARKEEYDLALKRMVRYSEFLERFISPEGTFPAFGRSMTYRTGAFQALAQVSLMEKLPEHIQPAQVRCALTKVMHNMFDGNQNFDSNGWLVLGFNGHQPMVADIYTSTGSLYICTIGFLSLGLPADNKFWADPAADWTSKKAWNSQPFKKDYKVEY